MTMNLSQEIYLEFHGYTCDNSWFFETKSWICYIGPFNKENPATRKAILDDGSELVLIRPSDSNYSVLKKQFPYLFRKKYSNEKELNDILKDFMTSEESKHEDKMYVKWAKRNKPFRAKHWSEAKKYLKKNFGIIVKDHFWW